MKASQRCHPPYPPLITAQHLPNLWQALPALRCKFAGQNSISSLQILGFKFPLVKSILPRGDGGWAKKEKNKCCFWYPAQKRTQPGPDGSNASGWYGRLRGPILLLSVINSDQLSAVCVLFCLFKPILGNRYPLHQMLLFPILICFFHVETHKVCTFIWGRSHVLVHKPWHEQVHSARSSCMAPERVGKRSEFGWK